MQPLPPDQARFTSNFPAPIGEFDGKRLRKAVVRKTVDYNSSIINHLQARVWQRDYRDQPALQPDPAYHPQLVPPTHLNHNSINAITTKFIRASTNKIRCPINCVAWTPEGRRLVTGASSGEFTLWNGLTFNFETILQAHDSPVRAMVWSHNDTWMATGDHSGYVKYWQSNMNNVKMFQAHKEAIRGLSFCPNDTKFASCSDDGSIRIWDFGQCVEERILRGHGADVVCVDWHPRKAMVVSGSKDGQQPVKFWDPKSGKCLATLRSHKSAVMDVRWNRNGNWLLTASRDHLVKLFDIRKASPEVRTFRGHKKEVASLAWHPTHETLFCSGGSDGGILFWDVDADKEVGGMDKAHDSMVWSLAWHPLGHILCSGSNDHSSKFWTRNSPGDKMLDKYNLNVSAVISTPEKDEPVSTELDHVIPGFGLGVDVVEEKMDVQVAVVVESDLQVKVPYSKPIPRQFQEQWTEPIGHKVPLLATPSGQQMSVPAVWRRPEDPNHDFRVHIPIVDGFQFQNNDVVNGGFRVGQVNNDSRLRLRGRGSANRRPETGNDRDFGARESNNQSSERNSINQGNGDRNLVNQENGNQNWSNQENGGRNFVNQENGGRNFVNQDNGSRNFVNQENGNRNWSNQENGDRNFVNQDNGSRNFANQENGGRNFANQENRGRIFVNQDNGSRNFVNQENESRNFANQENGSRNFVNQENGGRNFGNQENGNRNFGNQDNGNRNFGNQDNGSRNFGNQDNGSRNFGNQDNGSRNFGNRVARNDRDFGARGPNHRSNKRNWENHDSYDGGPSSRKRGRGGR